MKNFIAKITAEFVSKYLSILADKIVAKVPDATETSQIKVLRAAAAVVRELAGGL